MSCIDLNDIGRSLFKMTYDVKDKRKLSFKELEMLVDDALETFKMSSANIPLTRNKKDYISCLKSLLIICYIDNVNLNNHIKVELKEGNEETKRHIEGAAKQSD